MKTQEFDNLYSKGIIDLKNLFLDKSDFFLLSNNEKQIVVKIIYELNNKNTLSFNTLKKEILDDNENANSIISSLINKNIIKLIDSNSSMISMEPLVSKIRELSVEPKYNNDLRLKYKFIIELIDEDTIITNKELKQIKDILIRIDFEIVKEPIIEIQQILKRKLTPKEIIAILNIKDNSSTEEYKKALNDNWLE